MTLETTVYDHENRISELEILMKSLIMQVAQLSKEMKEFKDEMKEFKDWSKKNIEDSKKQIREMNKQWGNLSNKLGTIVEDIVFPATRPLLKKYFNCDPGWLGMNIEKNDGNLRGEFDVIAICKNNVFLIEVKATPKIEYINEFINEKVKRFKVLFPEFREKNLILIFASLRIKETI